MSHEIKITKTSHSRLASIDFSDLPFGKIFTDHMFIVKYEDGKWGSPEIKPLETLNIHPANMSLHYGQSIFEGMKATCSPDGTPFLFRPEMHAHRMNASAARMCMPMIPEEMFLNGIEKLVYLEKDWIPPTQGSALYIRPLMFATDEFLGVAPSNTYTFLILTLPVGPYYSKPVSLYVDIEHARAAEGGVGGAKTAGNYAASLLPAKKAKDKGYDQVLWMDGKEKKYIQEVGTMNIFFALKGKIITPSVDEDTILKGITRNSVIQILKKWGHEVEERKVSIEEIYQASLDGSLIEVFGTGTAAVIANVSKIQYGEESMNFTSKDWELSASLRNLINGMRDGSLKDDFGWIVPLNSSVLV